MKEVITCPACHKQFACSTPTEGVNAQYCPFCGHSLRALPTAPQETSPSSEATKETLTTSSMGLVSFLPEHLPAAEPIQFTIGPYQVLRSIGKGGMGEVFLAYDTTCGRRIALKKIRPDLVKHQQLHNRFLKEARITSQLTHPAIIPIYTIHEEVDLIYYSMPYVEGETLKHLLRRARHQEKRGEKIDHIAGSIPALIRIFLSICQAVAYAHSKHVLHRDLKPENIIIGQYGQIVILDWGLAKLIKNQHKSVSDGIVKGVDDDDEEEAHPLHHLTHVGKVVGTVAYMAPERALGHPANVQTDIYSLGVILYQLLTLKHPFHRGTLKNFRQIMHLEKLYDPIEVAPYRDISRSLVRVVSKCLASHVEQRYRTVDELIHDLENYIEGRSEWYQIAELDVHRKEDWEFQENVLIAEHVALAREVDISDWVSLMISKASFEDNIKLEAMVKIGDKGHGIGFLLSIPEAAERVHLNDGYCLWLGNEDNKSTKLLRSTVEVMHSHEIFLKKQTWHQICIEKIDNCIYFSLDNVLQFSYISHLPLAGTHVGILSRDADYILKNCFVNIRSQNVTVNCLAVPDAFLAHKDYAVALNEYRRIGYSFPGRAEGREAMFRAGITLLEQANNTEDRQRKLELYDLAQDEFHKLYNTPGAPLEYLGKALVYQALGEYEEEVKCFELAYRRYPRHPLLHILQEQIVYRMYESSRYHRKATYNFILMMLRHLPSVANNPNTQKLLTNLEKHWEPLYFSENDLDTTASEHLLRLSVGIKLAFWLARPYVIGELIDELLTLHSLHHITLGNALFSLIELGAWSFAQAKLPQILHHYSKRESQFSSIKEMLELALERHNSSLASAVQSFMELSTPLPAHRTARLTLYLMEQAIDERKTDVVHKLYQQILQHPLSAEALQLCAVHEIWAWLLEKNWEKAEQVLHKYPLEELSQDKCPLHFVYGCWLYGTEGKDIATIHFAGVMEVPYPRSWTLLAFYLKDKQFEEHGWMQKSFLWERRQLYRQLTLFYHCLDDLPKAELYRHLALAEVVHVA